jgi:hypothetical protein
MDEELKAHLTAKDTWLRGFFLLVFGLLLFVARFVTTVVVIAQFLFVLFSGKVNENLRSFGASLSRYIYQCLRFVTFNTEEKAFPFGPWPEAEPPAEAASPPPAPVAEAEPPAKPLD